MGIGHIHVRKMTSQSWADLLNNILFYRETYLLFTPDSSTFKQKKDIASVIAHEFAHQWFGDHVTPKTWDFNWMKEGMATLFEFFGTDLVYPEMKLNDLFTVEVLQNAFREDASASTKAMTTEGGTPSVITYDKCMCFLFTFISCIINIFSLYLIYSWFGTQNVATRFRLTNFQKGIETLPG